MVRRVIKLICVDVDGTLVGHSGLVSPAIWGAADRLRARGVRLALCSGRPCFGVTRALAERLDPSGWHVFQNGASIIHLASGQSLSSPLPDAGLALLIERARRGDRTLELYSDADYAVESTGPVARQHAEILGTPFAPRPFESLAGVRVRAQWLLSADQVAVVTNEDHPGLEMVTSTSPLMPETTFMNFTAAGISKGSALRQVAQAYGVAIDETMMVGDSDNDREALLAAGFPVAMGNAAPAIKALARAVVGHVDDDGLIEAFGLAD